MNGQSFTVCSVFDSSTCHPLKPHAIGDMIFLDLPGQPTVVLNSVDAAIDLLEKRSDIYSDRPVSLMHHLCVLL